MLCLCGKKLIPHQQKYCSDLCRRHYYKKPISNGFDIKKLRSYVGLFKRKGEDWFKLNHKEVYKKLVKYKLIK